MNWLAFAALVVSLLAASFSGLTLWRTHFFRGTAIFAPGAATLSVTQWVNSGHTWYTPDIVIPTYIANTGTNPITVQGLRVRVEYPGLPIPDAHEYWEFNLELDTSSHLTQGPGRNALEAEKGMGPPWIVLPKTNVEKRFVCWTRWEKPVVQPLKFVLEARTSLSPKWKPVEAWSATITPSWWMDFTETGSNMLMHAESQEEVRRANGISPRDLHKYTGPADSLPEKSREIPPSFVVHRGSSDGPDKQLAG